MSYETDRSWSDRCMPAIKKVFADIVVKRSLETADFETDTKRATDLILLKIPQKDIACRVRRPGYSKFANDFTIRCERDSGTRTEYDKIVEDGFGDWLLYCHAGPGENPDIVRWMLIDLDVFRKYMKGMSKEHINKIPNGDGTYFYAFDIRKFPPELILESSHPIQKAVGR